jgi:hypothetical protein
VTLGLRALLLILAVVLFVIAVVSEESYPDLLAGGLACVAAALLIDEVGLGKWRFSPRGRRTLG